MNMSKSLESLWRPFLILMRIYGLSFSNDPPWNPLKLYSLLVVCLSWCFLTFHSYWFFLAFYYVISFDMNYEVLRELSFEIYIIRISLKCIVIFLAFHRIDCMPRFYQLWSTLRLSCELSQRLETSVYRSTRLAFVVTVLIIVISGIVDTISWTMSGFNGFLLVPYIMFACVDCVSGIFCWVMATTMAEIFSAVNECFLRRDLNRQMTLETTCSVFYVAVDMVSAADSMLSVVFGTHIISNLLQCCIISYGLIFTSNKISSVALAIRFYWNFLAFSRLLFVFWETANVNFKAHRLLNHMRLLPVKNTHFSKMVQILVLQNRLSTYRIGFSMFGLQTITRGVLPLLLSGYITYVFILAQFHLGKKTPQYHCYCFQNNSYDNR